MWQNRRHTMAIWVIFALVWPCAPHSGLSVTILAHSDGIHSNSVTQSGSRWLREYRVSASGIRRRAAGASLLPARRPAWRACRPLSHFSKARHEAGRAQGHDDGYGKCRRKGAGHGLDRRGDGGPHRLSERGGQVEDAEILAGLLLSLPTSISQTAVVRKRRPFLGLRRPEWYA